MDRERCAHCGRPLRRWYGTIASGEHVCHYDDGPDCYRRITVYGERLGILAGLPVAALPPGVTAVTAA